MKTDKIIKVIQEVHEQWKGGTGSGNFGHSGRPGKRGGSSGGGKGASGSGMITTNSMYGKLHIKTSDVEKAKKLNRVAVANADESLAPGIVYAPVNESGGVYYAQTSVEPGAKYVKGDDPALAYDDDYMWLPEVNAHVYVGHIRED